MLTRTLSIVAVTVLASCATMPTSTAVGLLRLEVEPSHATLYIDETYSGQVDAWRDQTLVLRTGMHRVELVAEGFLSQRFDIQIEPDEETTLRLKMEPEFDTFEEDSL